MATHVNDVDFEIRIGSVVIDHGEWHIRTVLPRAFQNRQSSHHIQYRSDAE